MAKSSSKKKLVIVESPGKIKKISSILGSGYIVKASFGHIYDLPPKGLNIDIKNGFQPTYEVMSKKKDVVKDLKKVARSCSEIYLASDKDREGAYISWSLYEVLPKTGHTFYRVTFDSITKATITKAFASPQKLSDEEVLVEAQKSRRLLDRLVGFKITPLLWKGGKDSSKPTRSAGRVQSVGLRMIVERQKEIDAFKPVKYWTVEALVANAAKEEFVVNLVTKSKLSIKSQAMADKAVATLKKYDFIVDKVDKKQAKSSPQAPFVTSTLQQSASTVLGWGAKKTMAVAQGLYEAGLCVAPDTLVTSGTGEILTIKDFIEQNHSEIVGLDQEGRADTPVVQDVLVREAPEQMYRVTTTKNKQLTITGDHPLLRLDQATGQEWIAAKNLRVGDFVGVQQKNTVRGRIRTFPDLLSRLPKEQQLKVLVHLDKNIDLGLIKKWADLENVKQVTKYKYCRNKTLTLHNYLRIREVDPSIDNYFTGLQYRSAQSNPIRLNLNITPEFTRWVGLVLGDGSIGRQSIAVYKPDISPEMYAQYYGSFTGDFSVRKSNKTSKISIILLEALGYVAGPKSASLFIPQFISSLDNECVRGFIAGLWDSDGSIKITGPAGVSAKISYSSRSKDFINQLQLLLSRFEVVSSYSTITQEQLQKQNRRYVKKTGNQGVSANGDQHYLYINSSSWTQFAECVEKYLINRRDRLEHVRSVRNQISTKRVCLEQAVPINAYIENLREEKNKTKVAVGAELDVDYWNYYGKTRKGRTRVSFFNKDQVASLGDFFDDELLDELGNNDIVWDEIKEIEVLDNADGQVCEKVYDLKTSEHNFTCNGLITHNCTYMRTDSLALSKEAVKDIRTLIPKLLSNKYVPTKAPVYKAKKGKKTQEAHEAIRPTNLVDDLATVLSATADPDQKKLLELIWRRAIASQMVQAEFDKVEVLVKCGKYQLKAIGQTQTFDGYLNIWTHTNAKEVTLPSVKVGEKLSKIDISSKEHETKPPARYNEASLIKELEANGVGRPSTYSSIIETLKAREYVEMDGKAFKPTDAGVEVSDFLLEHFEHIIDVDYTSRLEDALDEVAAGDKTRLELLEEFWKELKAAIDAASIKLRTNEVSKEVCPACSEPLFVRLNRKTKERFLVCSDKKCSKTYDMDSNEKPIKRVKELLGKPCPKCGCDLVKKTGKYGVFYGCLGYSNECRVTANENGEFRIPKPVKKTGKKCPKCKKGDMVERKNGKTGEKFHACNMFPKCRHAESAV